MKVYLQRSKARLSSKPTNKMILLIIIILIPILYCSLTLTICSSINYFKEKKDFVFPLKSLIFESLLQYLVFIFLPIDLMRKWEINESDSNKYVILLPGYSETQFIFLRIRKMLKTNGINYKTLKYKPFFGDIYLQIENLKNEIDLIVSSNENAVFFLVGHSMGGLIGRYFVENYHSERIEYLIMIATPHKGTYFGKFGIGRCAQQIVPDSSFLLDLMSKTINNSLNVYSTSDNLICPRKSAIYNGKGIILNAMPLHNSTLFNCETLTLIKEIIIDGKY